MIFGYTILDPLVVLSGTIFSVFLLAKNPTRLIGLMPTALSAYFFIPTVTLLTLWQTVPLLLLGRILLRGRAALSTSAKPVFTLLFFAFAISLIYGIAGGDLRRVAIRSLFYLGAFSLFSFSYEMGRKPETYGILVRGIAVTGAVFAIYGLYQIAAYYIGLPLRGIVYGPWGAGLPTINGIPRINSFANEPKRLGYVLFLGAMAFFMLAQGGLRQHRRRRLLFGAAIVSISVFTFSTSYFVAIAVFAVLAFALYPNRSVNFAIPVMVSVGLILLVGSQFGVMPIIGEMLASRYSEVEAGTGAAVVYRQEFFAQEYLLNHPAKALTGVGLGQYNSTLLAEYWPGVGMSAEGRLLPLNSMFLEMILDFGAPATILFYMALGVSILAMWKQGLPFFALALLFLAMQSLSILVLQFLILIWGVGLGQIEIRRQNKITF